MGTFVIRPTVLTVGGTPIANSLPGGPVFSYEGYLIDSPYTALEALQRNDIIPQFQSLTYDSLTFTPHGFDDTIRVTFFGNSIYLDGDPTPISFAGLPAGFTATAAAVMVSASASVTLFRAVANYWLQKTLGDEGSVNNNTFAYDFSFPAPTMLDIVNNACGIRTHLTTDGLDAFIMAQVIIGNLRVEGTYDIVATVTGEMTPNTEPVEEGDIAEATSPDTDGVDFTQVETVTLTTDDGTEIDVPPDLWILILLHQFQFILPAFPETSILRVSITSTQFSGSVSLGFLYTIYFTSASGLYRLIPGQRFDELYIEEEPGETVQVKIPNPTFRTGFIGS